MNAKTTAKASTSTAATATATAVLGAGTAGISMPAIKRGGGQKSPYPWETLEVGQCFGVKGKTKREMSSAITNANRKGKEAKVDGEGNAVMNDGKPVIVINRHFAAFDVDAKLTAEIKGTDLEGSTVLVFRDK